MPFDYNRSKRRHFQDWRCYNTKGPVAHFISTWREKIEPTPLQLANQLLTWCGTICCRSVLLSKVPRRLIFKVAEGDGRAAAPQKQSLLITLSIGRELFFTNEALSVSMPEDVRAAFPDAINYTSSEVPSAQSNARSATAERLHATLARRAFLHLDPVAAPYPRSLGVPRSELPGLASLSCSGDFETDSSYRKQTESSQSNMIRPPQAVPVSY